MPHPPKISAGEVLAQALSLLEAGGEAGVTVRAVAARLGVTPNAIYWHYADKEALLVALTAHGLDELRAALTGAVPAHIHHPTDLLPVADAYLDLARTRPDLYKLFMSPRADVRAKGELWTAVVALLTPTFGPAQSAGAGVALWAYLHGVAGLDAMNPFHDGKPRTGAEAGLRALIDGLVRQGEQEEDVLPVSAG